ncbi:MAG: DUF167 family protein [Paracoccaceae bacterium]
MADLPWKVEAGGVTLAVRLTPRAHKVQIDGVVTDPQGRLALQMRVPAPPVDGAANTALISALAKILNISKAQISIEAGGAARLKRLRISGEGAEIAARLARAVSG